MNFSRIFNVFSKREKLIEDKEVSLTSEFRVRIFLLWTKAFPKESESRWSLNRSSVWTDIYENLLFSLGTPRLSLRHKSSRYFDDLVHFIEECSDEHFLDFVELSFQSQHILEADMNVHDVINNVNQFFQEDNLPFSLTGFIFGQNDPRIVAYPQIIRRDSQLLHQTAIEPVLELLSNPAFRSANREFLEALSDYRKKDYGDCVVKCGSAFESVMKVICEQKKWPYKQTDTAEPLLNTILLRTSLEPFFKQPIILVATIRNRLSSAHGSGAKSRVVPKHVANYSINATASAILLLVEETNP